jgi:hypothetical protein
VDPPRLREREALEPGVHAILLSEAGHHDVELQLADGRQNRRVKTLVGGL